MLSLLCSFCLSFFFNDTATTEIYTLSLHDALPILVGGMRKYNYPICGLFILALACFAFSGCETTGTGPSGSVDRKSTRLNSSHLGISYAVFCLKKKKI